MARLRWPGNIRALKESRRARGGLKKKRGKKARKEARRLKEQQTFSKKSGKNRKWKPQKRGSRRGWIDYEQYMASPAWSRKRSDALLYYGPICDVCGQEGGLLDVHHRTYARFGSERLADLQVLCRTCHERKHEMKNGRRASSWSGSENQRKPQGDCRSNGYVPSHRHKFTIKAGTFVEVQSVSRGGDWRPYKTKKELGFARYESKTGGFLLFREEGYWIRVWRKRVVSGR